MDMQKSEIIPRIRGFIAQHYEFKREAAKHWGISASYLSKILNNEGVDIPDVILSDIGYKKEVVRKVSYVQE